MGLKFLEVQRGMALEKANFNPFLCLSGRIKMTLILKNLDSTMSIGSCESCKKVINLKINKYYQSYDYIWCNECQHTLHVKEIVGFVDKKTNKNQ